MLHACLNMHSVELYYRVPDKPSHHEQCHITAVGGHHQPVARPRGATFLKAGHKLEMPNACLNMHSVERQYLVLDKPSHHVQRHATAIGGYYRRGQRNKGHNFEGNAHQQ